MQVSCSHATHIESGSVRERSTSSPLHDAQRTSDNRIGPPCSEAAAALEEEEEDADEEEEK